MPDLRPMSALDRVWDATERATDAIEYLALEVDSGPPVGICAAATIRAAESAGIDYPTLSAARYLLGIESVPSGCNCGNHGGHKTGRGRAWIVR